MSQWDYWGGYNQQWKIEEIIAGFYTITNRLSGKVLDVEARSNDNGTNIIQWSNNDADNQLWALESISNDDEDESGGTINITETIVVEAGETYDGNGATIIAQGMGDGGQGESQEPIFRLEDGATLQNVRIGDPGCDGVHTYGNATVENVIWEDLGEDALTIKEGGDVTVTVRGGAAYDAEDKIFQINDVATAFKVENFKAENYGKLVRQNGGTDFKVDIYLDNIELTGGEHCIARSDSEESQLYYRDIDCDNDFEWWKFPDSSQINQY